MVAICSSKATTSPRADTATSPSRRRRLMESSVRTDSSRLREWITAAAIAPISAKPPRNSTGAPSAMSRPVSSSPGMRGLRRMSTIAFDRTTT